MTGQVAGLQNKIIILVQNVNGYMFQIKNLAVRVVKVGTLGVGKKRRNENI
jgi:hypothetical protein